MSAAKAKAKIGLTRRLRLLDADWFIYAYYDDPREIYFSRLYRKGLKAFTMNFARYETRSAFHLNFCLGAGVSQMIVPISIFESDFVQSKYAFSCFMRMSPAGIHGIDANKDLYAIDTDEKSSVLKIGLWYSILSGIYPRGQLSGMRVAGRTISMLAAFVLAFSKMERWIPSILKVLPWLSAGKEEAIKAVPVSKQWKSRKV